MCDKYLMQKKAKKIREEENKRLENMTEEELLEDYKKTNQEASQYAKEYGLETKLITAEGSKEKGNKDI